MKNSEILNYRPTLTIFWSILLMTIFLKDFVVRRCLWKLHWTTPGNLFSSACNCIAEVLRHFQLVKILSLDIFFWYLHKNFLERIDIISCLYAELAFGKLQNGWPRYEIKHALSVLLQSYCRQTWAEDILVKVVVLGNARKQLMNTLFWWKSSGNLELKCTLWILITEDQSSAVLLMTERLAGKCSPTIQLYIIQMHPETLRGT